MTNPQPAWCRRISRRLGNPAGETQDGKVRLDADTRVVHSRGPTNCVLREGGATDRGAPGQPGGDDCSHGNHSGWCARHRTWNSNTSRPSLLSGPGIYLVFKPLRRQTASLCITPPRTRYWGSISPQWPKTTSKPPPGSTSPPQTWTRERWSPSAGRTCTARSLRTTRTRAGIASTHWRSGARRKRGLSSGRRTCDCSRGSVLW